MTIGTSLVLIAIGAILAFAVNADVSGIEISTVGIILMIVGAIGLLISLIWLMDRDRRASGVTRRERVVERDPYA